MQQSTSVNQMNSNTCSCFYLGQQTISAYSPTCAQERKSMAQLFSPQQLSCGSWQKQQLGELHDFVSIAVGTGIIC